MSDVLIDSSAWIAFLRGEPETVRRVDPLIVEDRAAINGVIYAEVLSGATDRPLYLRLQLMFRALALLPDPAGIWERVAETRFALARMGFQAAVTDLLIAVTALESGHSLLTRDRDFARITRIVPLDIAII